MDSKLRPTGKTWRQNGNARKVGRLSGAAVSLERGNPNPKSHSGHHLGGDGLFK